MNNEDIWRLFAALVIGIILALYIWKQDWDKNLYLQCLDRNETLVMELAKKGAVPSIVHFCRH